MLAWKVLVNLVNTLIDDGNENDSVSSKHTVFQSGKVIHGDVVECIFVYIEFYFDC